LLADTIGALKLSKPLAVASGTSVGQVIDQVQRHKTGCVLVTQGPRLVGIMTERDVLMKVVARDVSYDEPVDKFMTPDPLTLTPDRTIGEAITLMSGHDIRNIPIIDAATQEVTALFSIQDVIDYVTESFPEHVMNLPPRPHQKMTTPEGA
jgi:CBS domain-containing protein